MLQAEEVRHRPVGGRQPSRVDVNIDEGAVTVGGAMLQLSMGPSAWLAAIDHEGSCDRRLVVRACAEDVATGEPFCWDERVL